MRLVVTVLVDVVGGRIRVEVGVQPPTDQPDLCSGFSPPPFRSPPTFPLTPEAHGLTKTKYAQNPTKKSDRYPCIPSDFQQSRS